MRIDDGESEGERAEAPPHGITLFDHAEIAAEIAEGDRPLAEVLAARKLTDEAWNESTMFWMKRMGDDALAHGKDARVALVYSDAFSRAQDARRAVVDMPPEAYAALVVEIQRTGSPARPLASRGLSTADYLRLSRAYAATLTTDAEVAARFAATYEKLHGGGAEG
jgi:hypothetical protein